MSKKIILAGLVGAALACMPAFSKTPTTQNSDTAFLKMAAEADMTTAHIGKLAEDQAATQPVKDFGKTLVQDHTNDYQQLSELAAKLGDSIPKGIDRQDDRSIASMDRYHGKTFDHEFLTHETSEHEELIRAFKREAEHGTNPAIKDYASKALPTIEGHLRQAQDLLKGKA